MTCEKIFAMKSICYGQKHKRQHSCIQFNLLCPLFIERNVNGSEKETLREGKVKRYSNEIDFYNSRGNDNSIWKMKGKRTALQSVYLRKETSL